MRSICCIETYAWPTILSGLPRAFTVKKTSAASSSFAASAALSFGSCAAPTSTVCSNSNCALGIPPPLDAVCSGLSVGSAFFMSTST